MMIDNDLKVHVLEVNGRPQLQSHVLDKAVNRPMLAEMLKIIGKVLLTKSCRETYDICLVLLKVPKCCACPNFLFQTKNWFVFSICPICYGFI